MQIIYSYIKYFYLLQIIWSQLYIFSYFDQMLIDVHYSFLLFFFNREVMLWVEFSGHGNSLHNITSLLKKKEKEKYTCISLPLRW